MRPRERDEDHLPPESPSPASPPPRIATNLSSMVVRPPVAALAPADFDADDVRPRRESPLHRRNSPIRRRRDSPPLMDLARRRVSPPLMDLARRRDSPPPFRRRESPVGFYRRGGASPPPFRSRPQRFDSGYMPSAGSLSPSPHRPKFVDNYQSEFDHPGGPRYGRGFRGGRSGGRFRDVSPPDDFGRSSRSIGRGHMLERRVSPSGTVYIHRNDPNLSPREGDWICVNPRCGNLNFARRSHCNNCNKARYAHDNSGYSRSPRRDYFTSPPPRSPPRFADPPIRREINPYRSPPRTWGTTDNPRYFDNRPRFQDRARRDDRIDFDDTYRDRWARGPRERSRSPLGGGGRMVKGSFMGRGRGDRRYDDDSYVERSRGDERRGFHREDNESFGGRGRGRGGRGRMNGSDRY